MNTRPWWVALLLALFLLLGGWLLLDLGDQDRGLDLQNNSDFPHHLDGSHDDSRSTSSSNSPNVPGTDLLSPQNSPIEHHEQDTYDAIDVASEETPGSKSSIVYVVEGTVVSANGVGLRSVTLELFRHRREKVSGGAFEQMIRNLDTIHSSRSESSPAGELSLGQTSTDQYGRFVIEVAEAGDYRLEASSPPLARAVEGPFRLSPRSPQVNVLVVLGGGLHLSGFVTDDQGASVANATVSLLDKLRGELPGRHYHTHSTSTAQDGSFLFEGLEPRRYILTAVANGFARSLVPALSPPIDDVQVTLEVGRRVLLRVVREDSTSREPIEGARVYALNPIGFSTAISGADGIAHLQIPGEDVSLRVTADQYDEVRIPRLEIPEFTTESPESVIEIVLRPLEAIAGLVLRTDGSPAANAELLIVASGLFEEGTRSITADEEGRFQHNGRGALLARLNGEVSEFPNWQISGANRTVQLQPTLEIRGRLIGPDGWPAAGAEVWVSLSQFMSGGGQAVLQWLGAQSSVITGADGVFMLSGVPDWPGALEIVINAEECPDLRLSLQEEYGDLQLGAQSTLEGTVTTPGGTAPHAAAIVLDLPRAPPIRRDRASGTLLGGERVVVADDGSFFIDRLPPSTGSDRLQVYVIAPPYPEMSKSIALQPGANGPIHFELHSGGVARVTVESQDGSPIPAVRVRLSNSTGALREARSGADGSVNFPGLIPATYSVTAQIGSSIEQGVVEVTADFTTELTISTEGG